MLYIPQWFSTPKDVLTFDDLREAIHKAVARREKRRAFRKTLRSAWRRARRSRA